VRVLGPSTTGGWPILVFGVLAIVLQFWPQWRTPRVSLPAAALGFAAGVLALASALNTIGLGRTVLGEQTISPLIGIGLGVYLTLAGSFIAVLAGLAPMPPGHEPARAELRLWKASTAILASIVVLCGLSATIFGSWIGSGGLTGGGGTPTPIPFNAGILATPLINVEVDPLGEEATPVAPIPTREIPTPFPTLTEVVQPSPTLENATEIPTSTPTLIPPITDTPQPSPTATLSPTPTITPQPSPLETPTETLTPTPTLTPTTAP
jgi:hypothetical protein